jgi:hypothetical protein
MMKLTLSSGRFREGSWTDLRGKPELDESEAMGIPVLFLFGENA